MNFSSCFSLYLALCSSSLSSRPLSLLFVGVADKCIVRDAVYGCTFLSIVVGAVSRDLPCPERVEIFPMMWLCGSTVVAL